MTAPAAVEVPLSLTTQDLCAEFFEALALGYSPAPNCSVCAETVPGPGNTEGRCGNCLRREALAKAAAAFAGEASDALTGPAAYAVLVSRSLALVGVTS